MLVARFALHLPRLLLAHPAARPARCALRPLPRVTASPRPSEWTKQTPVQPPPAPPAASPIALRFRLSTHLPHRTPRWLLSRRHPVNRMTQPDPPPTGRSPRAVPLSLLFPLPSTLPPPPPPPTHPKTRQNTPRRTSRVFWKKLLLRARPPLNTPPTPPVPLPPPKAPPPVPRPMPRQPATPSPSRLPADPPCRWPLPRRGRSRRPKLEISLKKIRPNRLSPARPL